MQSYYDFILKNCGAKLRNFVGLPFIIWLILHEIVFLTIKIMTMLEIGERPWGNTMFWQMSQTIN